MPKVLRKSGSLRPTNSRMVSSGDSLTTWGEKASLALVDNSSSDVITINILVYDYPKPRPERAL